MARLRKGEKERRTNRISRLLHRCRFGLTEREIAQETGLHRRTVNNYLRRLDEEGKAHRDGRKWRPG
jgi:DNA-binding CsgD family transcriptional regulator